MNINKTLLFSSIIALSLLNGFTCIAMESPLNSEQPKVTLEEQLKQAQDEKEALAQELKQQRARPIYNIHSDYGTCPEGTGQAHSALYQAQANSLNYNNYYVVAQDISSGLSKVAVPLFLTAAQPIITEKRQKWYITEAETLEADISKLNKEILELNAAGTKATTQHNKDLSAVTQQKEKLETLVSFCRGQSGTDLECAEMIEIAKQIQKNQWLKTYKAEMGKEYVPTPPSKK